MKKLFAVLAILTLGAAVAFANLPLLPAHNGAGLEGRTRYYANTTVVDTQSAASGSIVTSPAYDAFKLKGSEINVSLNVTAVPGSGPSLTPVVQYSDDGANWYTKHDDTGSTFAAITATGAVTGRNYEVTGQYFRVAYTASGTGTFTFTTTVKQAQ